MSKRSSSSCETMSEHDLYRPIKRIRQACQNCRRKKARCTGERPECAFCVRLGQSCSYSDDEPGQSSNNSNHSSRNHDSSQELAERLSALESQMADVSQILKSVASTVQSISRTISTTNTAGAVTQPLVASEPYGSLPPIDHIRAAADLYFRYCHNQPYSLFHESSLRHKIEVGEVPTHLLFALLASTVRYSSDPFFEENKPAAVTAYAQQSWKSIVMPWNGIQSETELTIVQTILLLAIIDYTDGRTQASWIKVGLAIRLAQDFRMMVEPDKDLPPAQQEERRRVFWSFYLCDKMISCGRERPAVILDDHCKLHLPSGENEWRAGNTQFTMTLEQLQQDTSGIITLTPFAIATVMASLLGKCAQYALGEQEEQTEAGKTFPWNPRSKYSSLHSSLLQLESELSLNELLSSKITSQFMSEDGSIDQHRAAPLMLAHALFFLCQCLLYHPFLLRQRLMRLGQRTPQSFLAQTFHSCRGAATALSGLMDDVKSLQCETLSTHFDPFYGYCTMAAGTIHSIFLQASDHTVATSAQASFESSMQNLTELSFYWKSCGMMRSRLEDFKSSSSKYTQLVDPTIQEVHLSSADANDLLECLDYSRMSTTPRRKSEGSTSHLATLSQLPSPFFDEFVNLLPFSYSRPVNPFPANDELFSNPPVFDPSYTFHTTAADLYPSASMSHIPDNAFSNAISASETAQNTNSTTGYSPASASSQPYSIGISPGARRGSYSQQAKDTSYAGSIQQQNNLNTRQLTSPSVTMKRPWYETSV